MPLPVDLSSITVTSTYQDGSGAPLFGYVSFTPSTDLTDSTGKVILRAAPIITNIFKGAISQVLACTDNANISPSGWTWNVTEVIGNAQGNLTSRSYSVLLPHTLGATVDLSTLVPVTPQPNVTPFAVLAGNQTFTGNNTFTGGVRFSTGAVNGDVWTSDASGNGSWTAPSTLQPFQFNVKTYGAVGDGKAVHDGAMTSGQNILACTTSTPFSAGDVGKSVIVRNAGPANQSALVTTITGFTDPGHVTLGATASNTVSATIVAWATDDTAAFKSAVNAATAYAQASPAGYAEVVGLPALYGVFGSLVTGGGTLGNAQIPLPIVATTVNKVTLVLRTLGGTVTSATGAHWQQLLFQATGMTLLSGGVFANATAQANSITASGHPCVIGGPTQPNGYGTSALVYSNMNFVLQSVTIVTPLSSSALNYCGADLSGLSQAIIRDVNVGTTGTFVANDYISPSSFSGGLSKGILMPANGNNDICDVMNLSVWGGYTWAFLATEHTVIRNARLLYCWSALGIAGFYFNSVGAGHAFYADQVSVEGCTYNWYIFGQAASGVGPMIDIAQMDTESAAPTCRDDGNGGVQFSLGRIKLTGLYTSASISIPMTGLEVIDGQQRPGPASAATLNTSSTPVQNPHWRWATVTLAGGTVTAVKIGTYMGGVSAPSMTTVYSQSSAALPLMTVRVPPGGWLEVDCTVVPTTNSWVLD